MCSKVSWSGPVEEFKRHLVRRRDTRWTFPMSLPNKPVPGHVAIPPENAGTEFRIHHALESPENRSTCRTTRSDRATKYVARGKDQRV